MKHNYKKALEVLDAFMDRPSIEAKSNEDLAREYEAIRHALLLADKHESLLRTCHYFISEGQPYVYLKAGYTEFRAQLDDALGVEGYMRYQPPAMIQKAEREIG